MNAVVTPLRPEREYAQCELRTGAASILLEGRLQIVQITTAATPSYSPASVIAFVHGHNGRHMVTYDAALGWACDCPVRSVCHHIYATELVAHGVTGHGTVERPKDRRRG